MARGGARPGAGRKKGIPNKKQAALRAAAQRLAETGGLEGTPLDVLLSTMRWLCQQADAAAESGGGVVVIEGDQPVVYGEVKLRLMAVDVATRAAPYCHPRLQVVEGTMKVSPYEQSLIELGAANVGTSRPDGTIQ